MKRRKSTGLSIESLERRAQTLETQELLEAMDLQWTSVTQYLMDYRRTRERAILGEIKLTIEALYVLTDEVDRRQENQASVAEVAPTRQHAQIPNRKPPKAAKPKTKGYSF